MESQDKAKMSPHSFFCTLKWQGLASLIETLIKMEASWLLFSSLALGWKVYTRALLTPIQSIIFII
jgi:hypothetical protein